MGTEESAQGINYKIACVCVGIIIVFSSAAMALGIIWKQQGVNRVAGQIKKLESKMNNLQRTNNYLQTRFAREHTPDKLMASVSGELTVPEEKQVVWLNNDERSRNTSAYASEPVAMTLNLSFLNQQ